MVADDQVPAAVGVEVVSVAVVGDPDEDELLDEDGFADGPATDGAVGVSSLF